MRLAGQLMAQRRRAHSAGATSRRREDVRIGHPWAGLAAVLALAACAPLPPPQDKLAEEIATYYAHNASEEDGKCASPQIASVTRRKVLASSAESTRLRVRYSYFDPNSPDAADWSRVLVAERACTGFAERDFTLARGPLGYHVVAMSGPVREQP
jgi:hypothetical protein